MIYHITSKTDWEQAQLAGAYTAPSLQTEGFIHASTREQVTGTANLYYPNQPNLVLLCVDPDRLNAEVRYELSPGTGKKFPHIYGQIPLDAVVQVVDFPPDPHSGKFDLPVGLP